MTPRLPGTRKARRAALGAELRRLRQLAGVSQAEIATALNVNAATVSRVENGERPLSLPDLRTWAARVSAEYDQLERLEWMAEQALTESVPLADVREAGAPAIQGDIYRRLEQPSRYIAAFCPCYLTGLLQTPEYARRVYSLIKPPDEVEAAVASRLERQQVFYDPARRLEFIISEAALRWRTGKPDFLIPQLERLVSLAAFPNIEIRVIPSDAEMWVPPVGEFVLYDERDDGPVVGVETLHDDIETSNAQPYRDELVRLRRSALSGDEAVTFIRDLAKGIR
jgi:transcriptional regulator with XRE-family HTH domain